MNLIKRAYTIADEPAISILAAAMASWDLWHRAQAQVDAEGMTVLGDRGGQKAHPLLAVVRDARSQFFLGLKALHLDTTTGSD